MTYSIDIEKEKAIAKKVRFRSKRFIVCTILALAILILGIIKAFDLYCVKDLIGACVRLSLCLIAALLVFAIAVSGGRDILLARCDDRIILKDDELIEVFTPKYLSDYSYNRQENHLAYEAIESIKFNKQLYRYELYGPVECRKILDVQGTYDCKESKIITEKPLIIYCCFENMEMMINELVSKTKLQIEGGK